MPSTALPSRRDLANAIRALSMDAVQKAKSGHPGAPMGMADIAQVLFGDYLKHNPNNPQWSNRDRFVLSNGHGSMLIYALLHLMGYDVSIDDIKQFRQLHSKTPGHPEYGYTPGIETTTGPLGQGLANAVGMALAEKILAAQFNRPNFPIVDHFTYAFVGDGCLMEGISHEVCSLAGTWGLGKLIVFYDANGISIDGHIDGWFTDNTAERFRAYGWHVISEIDGHDPQAIIHAIEQARSDHARPSMIICRTLIGYGAPNKAGHHDCHGAPLGETEIQAARDYLRWPHAPFVIPESIAKAWDKRSQGQQWETIWQQLWQNYQAAYPELASEYTRRLRGDLPEAFLALAARTIEEFQQKAATVATRKASLQTLQAFAPKLPELLGGSADLSSSNLTVWNGSVTFSAEQNDANYLYYGVREFGMSAIMNGMALYGGFIPYGGTFLIFMDYARNAVRMAALMKQRVIFVYTHDSIGLGEDGPTHQPVEQLTTLRATPNLQAWRPCDATETAVAWRAALLHQDGPTALVLSRQDLPAQARDAATVQAIDRGGYILWQNHDHPELLLIATGSEVALAMTAAQKLAAEDIRVRVVSMPCTTAFDKQAAGYREQVLPKHLVKRIAIEAAHPSFWYKYVGLSGRVIGLDRFGESAPAHALFEALGFTVDHVIEEAHSLLKEDSHAD